MRGRVSGGGGFPATGESAAPTLVARYDKAPEGSADWSGSQASNLKSRWTPVHWRGPDRTSTDVICNVNMTISKVDITGHGEVQSRPARLDLSLECHAGTPLVLIPGHVDHRFRSMPSNQLRPMSSTARLILSPSSRRLTLSSAPAVGEVTIGARLGAICARPCTRDGHSVW